jgi:hypothetical protein
MNSKPVKKKVLKIIPFEREKSLNLINCNEYFWIIRVQNKLKIRVKKDFFDKNKVKIWEKVELIE